MLLLHSTVDTAFVRTEKNKVRYSDAAIALSSCRPPKAQHRRCFQASQLRDQLLRSVAAAAKQHCLKGSQVVAATVAAMYDWTAWSAASRILSLTTTLLFLFSVRHIYSFCRNGQCENPDILTSSQETTLHCVIPAYKPASNS